LKPWEHPDNTLDRELIYISRPNVHLDGSMLGGLTALYRLPLERRYHYDVQFDSHGFRNDHDIEQAPIVLIGDSFVQSTLVPRQSLVSSRLSQLFGVEVANLGQGGYGPQQELAVLRRYGLPPRPRVVVWMFFEGNDLYEAGRFEELTRDWDAILSDRNRFDKRSFSVNAVIALRDATTPLPTTVSDDARRKSCEFTRSRSEEGRTFYFFYTVRLSADDQAGLAATESSIRTARNIAAENGSELLLAYVPAKLRVYRDFCAFPADGYAQSWPLDNLSAVLGTWAAENRIAYLDLTDALKAEASRGELVYFPDDTHWNAAGNEVAATVIANAIAEAGWLR